MYFCVKVYLFLLLLIHIPWNVSATIEIFDPLGRKVESFRDREAPYEDDIPIMEGFIVLADPPDACTTIAEPTFLTNFTLGKFVLINGTEMCSFKRKLSNAERANFDFAVIFDPSPVPIENVHIGFDINIPVVLISLEDGLIIQNNYLYNNSYLYNYRIRIKPNIPDFSYYMYLFGAVIGVCFFVMLLFMMCLLIKCIQERRKSMRNRLSSRQIKQIPTAKFTKGDQYDVCAICLEEYNDGDKLRILPCSHAYHAKCVDPWLMRSSKKCPLCKRKITFGTSDDESDSEMTDPSETTPLLTTPPSTSLESQFRAIPASNWSFGGTSERNYGTNAIAGPSSLPDNLPIRNCDSCLTSAQLAQTIASIENPFSDSESEGLMAPPQQSVNNSQRQSSRNPVTVHVDVSSPDHSDGII